MLERMTARVERRARDKAAARAREIAARMAGEAPLGITAETGPDGIRLSGRGVARRFAVDPALRWLATEAQR